MTLGKAIREQRLKNNVGIKVVAKEVDVDYSHLSKIENEHLKPSKELIMRLAATLNGDADQWMILAGYLPDDIYKAALLNPSSFIKNMRRSFTAAQTQSFSRIKVKNPVISLFTGAGGLDLGLESAGFETVATVEFNSVFRETLRVNRPAWNPIEDFNGDITKISSKLILERSGLKVGEAALVVGGAPCQPFSNMGSKKGIKDNRGTLFQDFIRIVKETLPKGFIFENVEGLTQSKHKAVIDALEKEFKKIGYAVTSSILLAADYGVPQKRKRLFVVGCRSDIKPQLPAPTYSKEGSNGTQKWKTVREAFAEIKKVDLKKAHCMAMNHSTEMIKRMDLVPPGGNYKDLPAKLLPQCWKSGKYQGQDTFGRVRWNEPSVTIRTCAYNPTKGRYIHPKENRGLNTVEMAVLQSFPSEYVFIGGLKSIGEQIGNAVPPLLAEAVGKAMKDAIIKVDRAEKTRARVEKMAVA